MILRQRRSKQLWNEVRSATADGLLIVSRMEELERGELVDIALLSPPNVVLGRLLSLPMGLAAESCIDRFFESAKNQKVTLCTASTSNVIVDEAALHHMMVQPDALGWFTCAFWAVVICEFHAEDTQVSSPYVGALFLNMSLFVVRMLQTYPSLDKGAPTGLLDMATSVAGAVVHTIHLVVHHSNLPENVDSAAFRLSVERNIVWWVLGVDGVEAAKVRAVEGILPARGAASASSAAVHAAEDAVGRVDTQTAVALPNPSTTSSELQSGLSLQQQRLKDFEERLESITAAQDALVSMHRSRVVTAHRSRHDRGASRRNDAGPSEAQAKPFMSRSVALKRAGAAMGETSASGNGPRTSFEEIHERVQLTRDARRDVLEREVLARIEAKREAEREQQEAETYALGHHITGETWTGPQRHAVRSFHLDGVSPLVKFFLLAVAEHSSDQVFPERTSGAESPSAFQRVGFSALARTSAALRHLERRFRLPSCPLCKSELVREKSISAICGRCSRPAATTSAATLQCDHCSVGFVCRGCALSNETSHTRPAPAAQTVAALEPGTLFGREAASAEWCCFDPDGTDDALAGCTNNSGSSRPPSAASLRSNPRLYRRPTSTAARWSALIQELLATYRASVSPAEMAFNVYLREAKVNIALDTKSEVRQALDGCTHDLMNACGEEYGSEGVLRSKDSANGHVRPAALTAITRRPPSAPLRRTEPSSCTGNSTTLGAFITGVPTSHAPRDSLNPGTLLNRPMTPLRRPSSAMSSRPDSAHASRPHSALSRSSTSSGVLGCMLAKQRPASAALSRASAGSTLAITRDRTPSQAIPWTTIAPKESAALHRFRLEARDATAACMRRVASINASSRATEEASIAAGKSYKANISRYAVEHLQEVKRGLLDIRKSERDEAHSAMGAVTAAIEASAGVFHHPLKRMDAIKDALYAIDTHFEALPESFRAFALRYSSEQGAMLVSMIRDYKMTQRDQSQWPPSLDDTRCSRAREAAKYGVGAVYVSPARRGHWRPVPTSTPSASSALQSEEVAALTEDADMPIAASPSSQMATDAGDSSPVSIDGDPPETDLGALLAAHDPARSDHQVETLEVPKNVVSRPVNPNAPPSCLPATAIAGSDSLVLRSGVMMWDDTQEVVGKRAGDVRVRYQQKQRHEDDPFRLEIRMAL